MVQAQAGFKSCFMFHLVTHALRSKFKILLMHNFAIIEVVQTKKCEEKLPTSSMQCRNFSVETFPGICQRCNYLAVFYSPVNTHLKQLSLKSSAAGSCPFLKDSQVRFPRSAHECKLLLRVLRRATPQATQSVKYLRIKQTSSDRSCERRGKK